MIPLFETFPGLKENLPFISLCDLPTPVIPLTKLAKKVDIKELYLKQDGLTATPFGGNKVRKLEFLLAEAQSKGAKEVMTFGFSGSNHALATAVHAKQVGMKSISMLVPQTSHPYVERNLAMSRQVGAEIHFYPNFDALERGTKRQRFFHCLKTFKSPFIIPPGGSSPTGVTGYVNAAYELHHQIQQNQFPRPDVIYITLGTAGTFVGLLIGFKALDINIPIVPVRVVDDDFMPPAKVVKLFEETVTFLSSKDPSFPKLTLTVDELQIRDEFFGEGYAEFTSQGNAAIETMKETEGYNLDGTYTGKTFAAVLEDAKNGLLKDKKVLFWNTLNHHQQTAE
jgi:1-aminocyclopropane-1-carboxylate deaminase/D-cysteine desulfhydrase-like pyridoxal-dependent ACC family enzyme